MVIYKQCEEWKFVVACARFPYNPSPPPPHRPFTYPTAQETESCKSYTRYLWKFAMVLQKSIRFMHSRKVRREMDARFILTRYDLIACHSPGSFGVAACKTMASISWPCTILICSRGKGGGGGGRGVPRHRKDEWFRMCKVLDKDYFISFFSWTTIMNLWSFEMDLWTPYWFDWKLKNMLKDFITLRKYVPWYCECGCHWFGK